MPQFLPRGKPLGQPLHKYCRFYRYFAVNERMWSTTKLFTLKETLILKDVFQTSFKMNFVKKTIIIICEF